MTIKHQSTPAERTFDQVLGEEWEYLSEAARTVVRKAVGAAYKSYMVHSYSYIPEEEEDDMKVMRRAAAELTASDCDGLTKIWLSALAAAVSIDPYDVETLVKVRTYRAQLHRYYRMLSDIVEDFEWEKRSAENRKKLSKQEPADIEASPF